jgi:hypothetical protein
VSERDVRGFDAVLDAIDATAVEGDAARLSRERACWRFAT